MIQLEIIQHRFHILVNYTNGLLYAMLIINCISEINNGNNFRTDVYYSYYYYNRMLYKTKILYHTVHHSGKLVYTILNRSDVTLRKTVYTWQLHVDSVLCNVYTNILNYRRNLIRDYCITIN